jgi:hypothetical protein
MGAIMGDVQELKSTDIAQIAGATIPVAPEMFVFKKLLAHQFISTLVLVGILALGLVFSYAIQQWKPPLLILVTMAGMLGAFFSALTRLYNIDQTTAALITPTVRQLDGIHLLMYSLVPPIVGAVAAVVLYVVFVGDFLGSGGLFPAMSCKPAEGAKDSGCTQLFDVLNDYGPTTAKDYGKILVWAFIAGFSERFVPDTLQSFVAKPQQAKEM